MVVYVNFNLMTVMTLTLTFNSKVHCSIIGKSVDGDFTDKFSSIFCKDFNDDECTDTIVEGDVIVW